MRQSQLFTKTRKDAPKDEEAKNAQLLIRAGFIHKEMAGVYDILPLGLRVVEKIKNIIREEMNAIGGEEFIMSSLQKKSVWETTSRWDDRVVDVWFKSELKAGGEVGFGWSHEEPIVEMMKNHISSFRDLPVFVYQFQNKLRNELRAKSGMMRGREFLMKDMYSFTIDESQHTDFYNKSIDAYMRVYERVGLGEDTFVTFAAGGAFTEFSHEFQTVLPEGEDFIYINKEKSVAINEEVFNDATLKKMGLKEDDFKKVNSSEVGNIFNFGISKSSEMGLSYKDESGKEIPVFLGSYGIGITRLVGVLVEKFSDEKGIVWPESVSPFDVHLIVLNPDDEKVKMAGEDLYKKLQESGKEVLFDDRNKGAGEKFADADLIGIPMQMVISQKTLDAGKIEIKNRKSGEVTHASEDDILALEPRKK